MDSPQDEFNSSLSNAPSWFLRILVAGLLMMCLGAVRVESRITRLEQQDRMFAKTFENIDKSLGRIVVLLEDASEDLQEGREMRVRIEAQIEALTERTSRLSRFHEGRGPLDAESKR